jgi:hypothetical protein
VATLTTLLGPTLLRQHGVLTVAQARRLGLGPGIERRWRRDGLLERLPGGVLVATWVPVTWQQRVLVVALAHRELVLSHGTAARLHGLPGFAAHDAVEVMVALPRSAGAAAGAVVHRSRGLTDADVLRIGPAPVLTVPATLVSIAGAAEPEHLAAAVAAAVGAGTGPDEIRATALRWRRRGRSGPARVLAALDRVA